MIQLKKQKVYEGEKLRTVDLVRNLFEKYKQTEVVENYYGLLALYGATQLLSIYPNESFKNEVEHMLEQYPGNIAKQPLYNFESYKCGGNGKAFITYLESIGAIQLKEGNAERFRKDIVKYADKTLRCNLNEDKIMTGAMKHLRTKVWIDVITCITPFMLFTGLATNREDYIDCAAQQCFRMFNLFYDKENGLLHQGKGFCAEDKSKISEDHWSRGNGWGYVGLADLACYLPSGSLHHDTAVKYFREFSNTLLKYQVNGVWNQELTLENAWHESSGTALILYGMGLGLYSGVLERKTFEKPYKQGITALADFIDDDFSTLNSCPSCLCPGNATIKDYITIMQPKTNEPHSFGAIMMAFVQAQKNGITEIER